MMTKQEVFDKMAEGLLRQGRKSLRGMSFASGCMYRGAEGCRCAVGFLIPDEAYDPAFEGVCPYPGPGHVKTDLDTVQKRIAQLEKVLDDAGVPNDPVVHKMIGLIQNIHDGQNPDTWKGRLRATALDFKLEWKWEDLPLGSGV